VLAGLVGTWYVGWRVPTREHVLAAASAAPSTGPAATTAAADTATEPAGP
jgi:hypothetical protein